MAGGKGTRAASIASDIPKPMIPICAKPILEYQIDCLKRNNLTDIIIVIGHLGHRIKDYFGDGNEFGCNISYFTETEPLGTAGALYKIENLAEDFLLLNGDVILDMDFSRMLSFHKEKKAQATLAVHPNSHPYDSALIICNTDYQIMGWINKEDKRKYYRNLVNAGVHIINMEFLNNCSVQKEKVDLDRDILKTNIAHNRIFAYSTPEYIKDMGTPDRFAQVTNDINKGIVHRKNLSNKQKAVFLDRDGTINQLNGFIAVPEDLILQNGAAKAVKTINDLGYLAIVITNQPVIARGETDVETLNLIHMKLETDLGKESAYIDDLYYCPHHPDKGFEGERPEYKVGCNCRKPKPGMIFEAAKKYNIDLSVSYMAGDHLRDVQCGINAGCEPVFLTCGEGKKEDIHYDNIKTYNSLKEFADFLLSAETERL